MKKTLFAIFALVLSTQVISASNELPDAAKGKYLKMGIGGIGINSTFGMSYMFQAKKIRDLKDIYLFITYENPVPEGKEVVQVTYIPEGLKEFAIRSPYFGEAEFDKIYSMKIELASDLGMQNVIETLRQDVKFQRLSQEQIKVVEKDGILKAYEDKIRSNKLYAGSGSGIKASWFTSPNEPMIILYPINWYIKESVNVPYQLFISDKQVIKEGDMYETGIAVIKLRNAGRLMHIEYKNEEEFMNKYFERYKLSVEKMNGILSDNKAKKIYYENYTGYLVEVRIPRISSPAIVIYHAASLNDDIFATITLETTEDRIKRYEGFYKAVLQSAILF